MHVALKVQVKWGIDGLENNGEMQYEEVSFHKTKIFTFVPNHGSFH